MIHAKREAASQWPSANLVKNGGVMTATPEMKSPKSFANCAELDSVPETSAKYVPDAAPPAPTRAPKHLPPPAQIVLWDKSLVGKPCQPISKFDESLQTLVDKLIATCYVYRGVGIAAPQIGEFVQVAVIHYPEDKPAFAIVNPVIDEIQSKGEQIDFEACLSLPGASSSGQRIRSGARVMRCYDLVYSYQDLEGNHKQEEASGFLARAIAHEIDHMVGRFFIERVGSIARDAVLRNHRNFVKTLRPQSEGPPKTT